MEKGSENAAARAEGPWPLSEDGRASCVAERGDISEPAGRRWVEAEFTERQRARSGSKGSGGWFPEAERRTRDGSVSKQGSGACLGWRSGS